ncbi:MAG: hypothetical protein D6809_03755 [Gammaproteobacteria bacterium]|nr:MAG: hypothetical protein D6809_03755 [Gammaproteobacteria bacterium]
MAVAQPAPLRSTPALSPLGRTLLAGLAAALLAAAALAAALRAPWLGIEVVPAEAGQALLVAAVDPQGPAAGALSPGDLLLEVRGPAGRAPLDGRLAVRDPDFFPTFEELDAFFRLSRRVATLLEGRPTLVLAGGRQLVLSPSPLRPLGSLPWSFWLLLAYGTVALLVAGWLVGATPSRAVGRWLLLSAVGFVLLCDSIAVFSSRELVLAGGAAPLVVAANHLGNDLFGLAFVALLWHYPGVLGRRWLLGALAGLTALLWANELGRWLRFPGENNLWSIALMVAVGLTLLAAQWRRARRDPAALPAVRWLAALFALGVVVPVAVYYRLGWDQGGDPVTLLVLVLGVVMCVYAGMLAGVARVRLFGVERWWVGAWTWGMAALGILAVDGLVTASLPYLGQTQAWGLALAAVAWLYFPLRQWLWGRIHPDPEGLVLPRELPRLLVEHLARARPGGPAGEEAGEGLEQAWGELLRRLFRPLALERAGPRAEVELSPGGERLYVPALEGGPAWVLRLPDRGARTFDETDLRRARVALALAQAFVPRWRAYRKGMEEERARIRRDLHDEVGGRLLSLVHRLEGTLEAGLAREALVDLREVLHLGLEEDPPTDLEILAGRWRAQLRERLEEGGVSLRWSWTPEEGARLAPEDALALGRLLRGLGVAMARRCPGGWLGVQGAPGGTGLLLSVEARGQGAGEVLRTLRSLAAAQGWTTLEVRAGAGRATGGWIVPLRREAPPPPEGLAEPGPGGMPEGRLWP